MPHKKSRMSKNKSNIKMGSHKGMGVNYKAPKKSKPKMSRSRKK